jgi:hypothetical protein
MAIYGGCFCGAVRYELARDSLPKVYCCHCRDCQKRSGSAFNETAVVRLSDLKVTGPVAVYEREMPGGGKGGVHICGTCSSPLLSASDQSPLAGLRPGSLDDSYKIVPVAHIWTSRRQPWVTIPQDVPSWPEAPPPKQFAAALRGA